MGLGVFKGQPWIINDTVVARSFLLGDNRQGFAAVGGKSAAISRNGEINFFDQGRTEPSEPWYTSLELVGQLSYGFEAWVAYLLWGGPPHPFTNEVDGQDGASGFVDSVSILAQAILNFGVLLMDLGQEEQMAWPTPQFGAGGGLEVDGSSAMGVPQNSIPEGANVQKLAEPIEIPRTQNLNAKIRLAPEVHGTIGTIGAPGVGSPLSGPNDTPPGTGYVYVIDGSQVFLDWPPYSLEFGLIGRRIKRTQYGQEPEGM